MRPSSSLNASGVRPLLPLLLLVACSSLVSLVRGQTQVSFCWLGVGPQEADQSGGAYYWSSQVTATLTLNTSLALASLTGGYSVTAVSGMRTVASLSGNNAVGGSAQLSLTPPASCPFGCDNLIFPARNAPLAGGLFDGLGLSFTLAAPQVDISGCDTTTFKIYANDPFENSTSTQQSNCDDEINVGGQAAVYAVGSPLPAQCRPPSTIQSYVCGIGPYSFAPMATGPDLVGSFSGSTLFVRLCGAVSQGNCVSQFGSSVMACQIGQSSLSLGFNFAYAQQLTYSPSGPALTFSYINGVDGSAGIAFTGADGELCNGAPRQFLGSLTCGATAQILNYTESPTCAYHYIISTPLACPPATNLAFCQISSTAPVASYNTWMTAITGVINGTFAPPSQQANYGQSGVTYIAQNFVGSASISFSTLYASTNSTSLVAAAGLNYTGATALSAPISIAPVGSFEGNDNVVYYVSNSSTGWVTNGGFSFNYQSGNSSLVFYDPASGNLMAYYDSFLGYALYYSFLQIAPLGSSTTLPAGWCSLPTLSSTATAGASVSFGFCYLTYVTNVFSAYTTSFYWASSATGVITATSTANTGQYLVTGISGTRTLSTSFGFQASAAGSASLSLGSGSGNSPSTPQYVYVNSPLNFNSSSTDGVTGLTFALSSNQTDASGCTGSAVTSYGTVVVCNGNEGSSATSYLTSLTLVSGSTAPPCSPLQQTPVPYACGIGAYDFTSLSTGADLNFSQNGYTIFFRMCGAVSQSSCVSTFGSNVMACQYISPTALYELAAAQSPYGAPQFSYVNGVNSNAGVLMVLRDGQTCNSDTLYPRMLYVTLLCDATSSSSSLVYYEEWATTGGPICWYNLTVLTPLACPPAPIISTSTSCAIGNYNFTGLATGRDLVAGFAGYGIYMKLCGAVSQPWCAATIAPTQVCQYYSSEYGTTGMAYTNSAAVNNTQFSYVNGVDGSAGIAYAIANGDSCGGTIGSRRVQGIISCGNVSQMVSYAESPECTYNINITTPLACNGGYGSTPYTGSLATRQFAFCLTVSQGNIIPGYSIIASQISGVVTATQQAFGSNVYAVTAVTGSRSVTAMNGSSAITSTVTLTGTTSAFGSSNLIYYNQGASLVYVDAKGIAVGLSASQSDLTGCSGSVVVIDYGQIQCGNGFLTLSGYSITWTPLLTGVVAPTCQITGPTVQAPGYCGVAPYSLASLASGPDLNFTSGGYTIYARLCGAVTQPDCVATFGSNAQICQWASSSSQYEIASYLSPSGETSFSFANGADISAGLLYSIQDGEYCGSGNTFPRTVNGTITCGASTAITSYAQLNGVTCLYTVNFITPLVCSGSSTAVAPVQPAPSSSASSSSAVPASAVAASAAVSSSALPSSLSPSSSSSSSLGSSAAVNTGGSSSSSLSGGAIAGIVIGSVVGALLLLGLLIFLCAGCSRSDTNKSSGGAASGSTYGEVENSHTGHGGNPGSVEMEQVTN